MKGFPPPDVLLKLTIPEVANYLLQFLNEKIKKDSKNNFSLFNEFSSSQPQIYQYASIMDVKQIGEVLAEAWEWLTKEGYLARSPEQANGDFYFVTREGRKIKNKSDIEKNRYISLLPTQDMDEELREAVSGDYIRADFESAVMKGYKVVETRIRRIAELPKEDYGIPLIRKAFEPKNGLLVDKELSDIEKQRVLELFMGAYGSFRNPVMHRSVDYENAVIALGLILLANFMLSIIEKTGSKFYLEKIKSQQAIRP